MVPEIATATTPTATDACAPNMSRVSMSRPRASVPRTWNCTAPVMPFASERGGRRPGEDVGHQGVVGGEPAREDRRDREDGEEDDREQHHRLAHQGVEKVAAGDPGLSLFPGGDLGGDFGCDFGSHASSAEPHPRIEERVKEVHNEVDAEHHSARAERSSPR